MMNLIGVSLNPMAMQYPPFMLIHSCNCMEHQKTYKLLGWYLIYILVNILQTRAQPKIFLEIFCDYMDGSKFIFKVS